MWVANLHTHIWLEDTPDSEVLSHPRGCVCVVCVRACVCVCVSGVDVGWDSRRTGASALRSPQYCLAHYRSVCCHTAGLLSVAAAGCLEPQLLTCVLCCFVLPLSITFGVPGWTSLSDAGIISSGLSSPGSPAPQRCL